MILYVSMIMDALKIRRLASFTYH